MAGLQIRKRCKADPCLAFCYGYPYFACIMAEVIRIKLSELSDALREKRMQRQGADLIAFPIGGRQRFP
jgi:hypothetical protein